MEPLKNYTIAGLNESVRWPRVFDEYMTIIIIEDVLFIRMKNTTRESVYKFKDQLKCAQFILETLPQSRAEELMRVSLGAFAQFNIDNDQKLKLIFKYSDTIPTLVSSYDCVCVLLKEYIGIELSIAYTLLGSMSFRMYKNIRNYVSIQPLLHDALYELLLISEKILQPIIFYKSGTYMNWSKKPVRKGGYIVQDITRMDNFCSRYSQLIMTRFWLLALSVHRHCSIRLDYEFYHMVANYI